MKTVITTAIRKVLSNIEGALISGYGSNGAKYYINNALLSNVEKKYLLTKIKVLAPLYREVDKITNKADRDIYRIEQKIKSILDI